MYMTSFVIIILFTCNVTSTRILLITKSRSPDVSNSITVQLVMISFYTKTTLFNFGSEESIKTLSVF